MRQYALATPGCSANRPREGRSIEGFIFTDLNLFQLSCGCRSRKLIPVNEYEITEEREDVEVNNMSLMPLGDAGVREEGVALAARRSGPI